jgi:hypothetical protein
VLSNGAGFDEVKPMSRRTVEKLDELVLAPAVLSRRRRRSGDPEDPIFDQNEIVHPFCRLSSGDIKEAVSPGLTIIRATPVPACGAVQSHAFDAGR